MTAVRQFSGPLPEPDDLVRYENLLPGAAERIFTMAEAEQRHRTTMEQATLVSDQKHRDMVTVGQVTNAKSIFRSDLVGQILGGMVALGCVAGATFSMYMGAHPTVTIAFVSLPVIGIIKAVRSMNTTKSNDK